MLTITPVNNVLLTNISCHDMEGQTSQLSHFERLAFSLVSRIHASLGHLFVGDGFKLFSDPREMGVLSGGGRWSQDGP